MKDVTVDMGKAASVLAQGWSYAKASVQEEDVNLYGLSVGVNVVNARADGDFRSYVEGRSGGEINVQSLSVRNEYHSLADALSRQPSLGIGAVEVDTNVAYANAGTVALSYIGGSGKVVVPTVREDCMVIPQTATYELQNRVFTYKVVDGKAHSTPVEVFRLNNGTEYIVESGLEPGDVIVAEGAGLVREGTVIEDQTTASTQE